MNLIGQASSGFDEEDSEVVRVRGEVPQNGLIPSLFVRGPDLLNPRDAAVQLGGEGYNGGREQVGGSKQ